MRKGSILLLSAASALVVGSLYAAQSGPELAGAAPVMRRLTEVQYRNAVQDIFGDVTLGGRFEPDERLDTHESLITVSAAAATVTPGGVEEYDRLAMGIAAQVVAPQRRDQQVSCRPASPAAADEACSRTFLGSVGHLLFRRPLTEAELAGVVKVAAVGAAQVNDFYFGLQLALGTLLQSPNFLFIQERWEPDPSRPGAFRLTAPAIATRLSLLLWASTPDLMLLKAAESGELSTPQGLARQVDRMLASPRLEAGVRAFFSDMLGFDKFGELPKDGQLYPNWGTDVARQAQEQTLRTIVDHLIVRNGDYRDLFTTNKTFLTPLLASVYGVPYPTMWGRPWEWTEFDVPKNMPQAGILTHISFLALHSHPGKTSPTLRGKALREVLLCQAIPPPPPDVDFSKFEASATLPTTLRDRINEHAENPACATCHKLMDPLGLALEHYDTIGKFRTDDGGKAIDGSGVLDEVTYQDATGLGRALHDNPKTASCVARRLFAYATGRRPSAREILFLRQNLDPAFAADGYRLPQLMRRLALDQTLYRIAPPELVASAAPGQ